MQNRNNYLVTQTSKHYLRQGCELLFDGRHVVVAEVNDEHISLECVSSNSRRTYAYHELESYYTFGRLVPRCGSDIQDPDVLNAIDSHSLIGSCSSKAQSRVLDLKMWLNALRGIGVVNLTPGDILQQHMNSLLATHQPKLINISPWTLYRNEKKLRAAGGDHKALIPLYHQRGKTVGHVANSETGEISEIQDIRLSPEVAQIVNIAIENARQDEKKIVRTFEVFGHVKKEVERINCGKTEVESPLILPSKMTVSRWINRSFTSHEMAVRQLGKKGADKLFRRTGARLQAERILECSQHDDIDTRVFLIDEETGLPWGTAYMTFCVDEYSRAVLGCKFGVEHRSIESALATVFHGIRRKDMSGPEFSGCKKDWVMRGLPGLALLDNASYNAALAFHRTLMDLGMDFAFARPHTPTDKSAVEFFNGQFKGNFAASLPGAAIKKGDRDASGRGMKTASLTLDEFNAKSMQWIVDEYHFDRKDSGCSPMEKWSEQEEMVDLHVPDPKIMEFLKFNMVERLKLRDSGGLLRNKLRYQNDALEDLQRRLGPRTSLDVRVNLDSLASLYVRDPQADRWFQVSCIEDERYLRGLTESQHKLIVKYARTRKTEPAMGIAWASNTKDEIFDKAHQLSRANDVNSRGDGYRIRQIFKMPARSSTVTDVKPKNVRNTLNRVSPKPVSILAPEAPVKTKLHPNYKRMLDYCQDCQSNQSQKG